MKHKNIYRQLGLAALLAAAALFSLFFGQFKNADWELIKTLRLPRVLIGAIVGAGLGASGAVMQGVLQNPLADPYILGTSSGAALGVLLALISGVPYSSPLFYIAALAGAFTATALSYTLARTDNRTQMSTLILAGVMVSTFAGAVILLLFMVYRMEAFAALMFIMGSVTEGVKGMMTWVAAMLGIGFSIAIVTAKSLDILALGEDKALSLGVNTERIKLLAFISSSLMTGAAVCAAGTIGFIGLIIPHITRILFGPAHKNLIICSALMGAAAIVLLDTVARTAFSAGEIPVGILTALSGAPFFLWLLRKNKKGAAA